MSRGNKIAVTAGALWSLIAMFFVVFTFSQGKNPYGPIAILHHGTFAFFLFSCGLLIRGVYTTISFTFKEILLFCAIIGIGGNLLFLLLGLAYLSATWDTNFPIYFADMTTFFDNLYKSGDLEKIGQVNESAKLEALKELKNTTAWKIIFNDFSKKMIISLPLSIIIAIVMRKSPVVKEEK